MYCPASVNAKIAKVAIAIGEEIKPFDEFEVAAKLAGGHLAAQLDRYQKLWRIHFFIDRDVKQNIGERFELLQKAVEKLALEHLVDNETVAGVAASLASALVRLPSLLWSGSTVKQEAEAAAFRNSDTALGSYPLGAPSIRSYIEAATRTEG